MSVIDCFASLSSVYEYYQDRRINEIQMFVYKAAISHLYIYLALAETPAKLCWKIKFPGGWISAGWTTPDENYLCFLIDCSPLMPFSLRGFTFVLQKKSFQREKTYYSTRNMYADCFASALLSRKILFLLGYRFFFFETRESKRNWFVRKYEILARSLVLLSNFAIAATETYTFFFFFLIYRQSNLPPKKNYKRFFIFAKKNLTTYF